MRFALLSLLAGCSTPTAGVYGVTVTNTATSCPDDFFPLAAPVDTLEIEVAVKVPEVVLQLIPEEHCPLDGMAFSCEYAGQDDEVDYNADGLDALTTTDAGIRGEWSDDDSLTALTSLSSVCEGTQCAELAETGKPECTVVWYWEGELVEG